MFVFTFKDLHIKLDLRVQKMLKEILLIMIN